jgi:hypothetical protein
MANLETEAIADWGFRHNTAVDHALDSRCVVRNFETSLVHMLTAWAVYAESHKIRYESPIGEDFVLGTEWRQIGLSLRGLLNGETGRLDCGTLDSFILDTLKENGFGDNEF